VEETPAEVVMEETPAEVDAEAAPEEDTSGEQSVK
jgi:hypothetical protein